MNNSIDKLRLIKAKYELEKFKTLKNKVFLNACHIANLSSIAIEFSIIGNGNNQLPIDTILQTTSSIGISLAASTAAFISISRLNNHENKKNRMAKRYRLFGKRRGE